MWLRDEKNTLDVALVKEVDSGPLPRLRIQPRSLASGFYHVGLSARDRYADGREEMVDVDDGYIEILAAPLIIRLLNTSMSRVSVSQDSGDLCLRPEVYSIAPTNAQLIEARLPWWNITCTVVDAAYIGAECGIAELPSQKGSICIPTKWLQLHRIYKFMAVGRTLTQVGKGEIEIVVDAMGALGIRISALKRGLLWEGFDIHGAYISANATLVLTGRCSEACPKPYQWRIFEVRGGESTATELLPEALQSNVEGA
ncbi:unnamed protein product [Hydatigera taeniaeformis]|uniref:Ig-like domain-containing protein n=1 Tax=Hydatigena taeniaeformis TaxID=6205 RepID=A0A0R3WXQ2_HYDTA|nr:unnamed protein product [Hydatigera taeniaeformis]